MAGQSPFVVGIALAFLVIANPVRSEDKCRTGCHGVTPNTFKFADGTTYKYTLEGTFDIGVSSAEGQTSSTKLKANVLLTQLPQCNQILRLQNVEVISADGKKYTNIPNIDKPVKLNAHDGQVEDIICAEKDDTQVSLNIKRAVASMFQANLKTQYETDVFGLCPTDSSTKKEGNFFIINKHKNLNKCSHRENLRQGFMSTAFNLDSEIKSSPILNSDMSSEQKLKNGVVDHVTVTENYLYVPFSVGKNGVKATVTTKLQLTGQSKDNPKANCVEPKSIIFENPHPSPAEKPTANSLIDALKTATEGVTEILGEHTAKGFINVVQIMRASKKEDLLRAYDEVKKGTGFKDKDVAKKFFLNALSKAGTGESIEVSLVLLKKKEITCPQMQKKLYLGLTFVRHATPGAIATATTFLDDKEVPREAYLGVGSLAGAYLRQHPHHETEPSIKTLISKLQSKLVDPKTTKREQENEMVYILKAVRNMRYVDDSLMAKVIGIANNKNAPTRLRVAALDAYLADPCKDKFRDSALNILKDIQQDSELRIKAYLALVECPNGKVAAALKKLIDDEPSIQVKGYISSHLKNLKASTNPDKELAKQQLGAVNVNQKYPIDYRRFSQNFEFSHTLDTFGLASTVEADLIYSQNSFLPRSTSLNLTADVFGHRYNFLELSTRQENLDKLMEHYFGPQGLMRQDNAKETFGEYIEKTKNHFEERMGRLGGHRAKRDVSKTEIDNMGKQVQIKTNELNKDLDLDLSVKMLGSEIFFWNINENSKEFSPNNAMDNFFDKIENSLEKLKNFDYVHHGDHMFLDAEIAYPTSMGFPLKVTVDGAASTLLKSKGNVDLMSFLSGVDKSIARLSMIPSVNVEVVGKLTVDAYVVESGLKTASTLHSATGSAFEIQIFSGETQGYDVKYQLPLKKQDLVSFNHEVLFNSRELGQSEVDRPLKFPQTKDFEVCADQLSQFVGLTFCAEINRPNTPPSSTALAFPLDGHTKFRVSIENDDLKEFHTKILFKDTLTDSKYNELYEIVGNNGPKVKLESVLNLKPDMFFKIDFIAKDLKTAGAEGKLVDTSSEKSVYLKGFIDADEAYGKLGFKISGGGNRYVLQPILDYKYPNMAQKAVRAEGQIVYTTGSTTNIFTFENFKIVTPDNQNIVVKGSLGRRDASYYSDVSVGDGKHTGTLKGNVVDDNKTLKVNVEVQNTFNPDVNFKLQYDVVQDEDTYYDNKLIFIHGKDLTSKVNKLTMHNSFKAQLNSTKPRYLQIKNELNYPLKHFDGRLNYGETDKSVDYDVAFTIEDVKFGSKMDLKYDQKTEGDYDLEFEVHGVKNKLELTAKRVIKGVKSDLVNVLDVNGKKYEVRGTVTHDDDDDEKINYGGDLVMKVHGVNEPYKVGYGFTSTDALDTYLKVQSGSNVLIDNFLKVSESGDANGAIKVNFKGIFVANGQLKSIKGIGNGNILIDFVKVGRKVKGETTYKVADPVYDFDLTVFTDFEKDNSKKYVFSSHNKITEKSFDSKVDYEYQGQKFQTSMKGAFDGEFMDGKQLIEAEVVFPNELYLLGKINREMHMSEEEVINGNVFINLEQRKNKNTPGLKFTFKGAVKDTDFAEDVLDLEYGFSVDNSQGKNLNGDFALKSVPKGEDNYLFDLKSKLYGSVMPNTYEGNFHSEYSEEAGKYKLNTKYGPKNSLDVTGNYDLDGETKPYSGAFDLVLHTSSPTFSVFKYSAAGSVGVGLTPDVLFDAQGKTAIFVDDNGQNKETTLDLKYDGAIKIGEKVSDLKSTIQFQKEDPISVAATVSYDEDEEKSTVKSHGSVAFSYAKDKTLKVDYNYDQPNENEFTLDAKVLTPNDKAKNTRIQWHAKINDDETKLDSTMKVTTDGKVYDLNAEVDSKTDIPSFSFVLKHPDGKADELSSKVRKLNPKEFAGDLKLACSKTNFILTASVDSKVESADEFTIKVNADSPALKINKVYLEASTKGGKGAKKIQFIAKSADKNILSGSTNYKTSDEPGKFSMEGSGSFKYGEETKAGNFKYVQSQLNNEKHGEEGSEMTLDIGLGPKTVDLDIKLTNKQFKFLDAYCEDKNKCAKIEIDSKVLASNEKEFKHTLDVTVDLRKLGLDYEFGMNSLTSSSGATYDHHVDMHFNHDKSKYQYNMYFQPSKSGAALTTPKRTVAIEGTQTTPKNKPNTYEAQLAIFMDKKNKPNEKTVLYYLVDSTVEKKTVNSKLFAKFSTPGLGKDLSFDFTSKLDRESGEYEFTETIDVFAKPNQKIIATGKSKSGSGGYEGVIYIKSAGLNMDIKAEEKLLFDPFFSYEYAMNYQLDKYKFNQQAKFQILKDEIKGNLMVLDKDIVTMNLKHKIEQNYDMTYDLVLSTYGIKPVAFHAETRNNLHKYLLSIARKETPNNKLVIQAGFQPGQIADARAEIIKEGKKTDLAHGSVKLDEANFMKSDFGLQLEELKNSVLEPAKKDFVHAAEAQKELINTITADGVTRFNKVSEVYTKNSPNFKPAKEYYVNELGKLKEELVSDKTLKEISDNFKNIFGASIQALSEIFTKIIDFNEKVFTAAKASFSRLSEAVEKEFIPKFKVFQEQIGGLLLEVFEVTTDTFFTFLAKVSDFINAHQKELKGVLSSISSIVSDVARVVFKSFSEARDAIAHEIEGLVNEVKNLQIVEQAQEMVNNLLENIQLSEILMNFLQELKSFGDSSESPVLKKLINDIYDYVSKKIKGEPVDDEKAIKAIAMDVTKLISQLTGAIDIKEGGVPTPGFNFDYLSKLPKLVGAKFSALNYLLEDYDFDEEQFFYNVALNPRLIVPPLQLQAIVVQGQHIFTFDGKHLTFPGSCNYLLARDAVNGNFTIGATYANGFLSALTVADKHDSITVKSTGQATANNAASEYPIRKKTIEAVRTHNSIQIRSKAGLKVICDLELKGCAFLISGFYHGQLRGLLGNGNSEPFDDFTIPNGKIVTSESDFGNAYKMQSSCVPVKTVDHHHHPHNKPCTQYFADEDSDLSECFPFVPPGIYRTACDHGTAAGVKDTIQWTVSAYASACNFRGFDVSIPDEFVKCTNGDKPRSIDDSFTVKLPSKAADVVIVIDEAKANEVIYKELVSTMIAELNKEFASKKVSDVEYHFIGYGGETDHKPYHYTIGGKYTSKGKTPNIQFTKPVDEISKFEYGNYIIAIRDIIKDLFGLTSQAKAYQEAIDYPFRAHAVKTVIAITGKPCEKPLEFEELFDAIREIRTFFLEDDDITINLVTPFDSEKFSCKDAKTTQSVIGFNQEKVFTYNDLKKKSDGSADLRESVKYDDYCVDYTLEKGGNVFVTNNFLSAKGPQRKQFATIVAHRIAHKLSSSTERLNCDCERVNFFTAKNVCTSE